MKNTWRPPLVYLEATEVTLTQKLQFDLPAILSFVLSNSLSSLPQEYEGKAELISGSLSGVVAALNEKGYEQLYIDGGTAVQSFLEEDLIDEMIITVLPILLGGGSPLFRELPEPMDFDLVNTEVMLNAMVKNHYRRKR